VQEHRFATDSRHDNRLPAFHHAPRNTLAEPVADTLAWLNGAGRSFDLHVAGLVVQQDDGAANGTVMVAENLQDPLQRRPEVERPGQRLTGFEERGQLPHLSGVAVRRFHPLRGRVRRHVGGYLRCS
jgi:hypothetical protein